MTTYQIKSPEGIVSNVKAESMQYISANNTVRFLDKDGNIIGIVNMDNTMAVWKLEES